MEDRELRTRTLKDCSELYHLIADPGLLNMFTRLNEKEKFVVENYWGKGRTLKDIAFKMDLSAQRIQQVYAGAVRKLKWSINKAIEEYNFIHIFKTQLVTLEAENIKLKAGADKHKIITPLHTPDEKQLQADIICLNFSYYTSRILKEQEIKTIGDIVSAGEAELRRRRGVGERTIQEIKDKLLIYNMYLQ